MPVSRTIVTAAFIVALTTSIGAAQGTAPEAAPVEATPCGAEHFQDLVGTHVSATALPEHGVLVRPTTIRATIYLPERLNIGLDETGYIATVYCG